MNTTQDTHNPNELKHCDRGGWVVGPQHPVRHVAWREGEAVFGCADFRCGRCGRKVMHFPGQLLRERPSPDAWLDGFDADGLANLMMPASDGYPYTTWICGCRAFPCADARNLDTLAIDDDLPWYCAGHPV